MNFTKMYSKKIIYSYRYNKYIIIIIQIENKIIKNTALN